MTAQDFASGHMGHRAGVNGFAVWAGRFEDRLAAALRGGATLSCASATAGLAPDGRPGAGPWQVVEASGEVCFCYSAHAVARMWHGWLFADAVGLPA